MSYAPIVTESALNQIATYTPTTSVSETKKNQKRTSRSKKRGSRGPLSRNYPIIVHSHLCWDWVWQRPQQFISRLSRRHKVLFVETVGPDPELAAPLARFRKLEEFPNITVLRLQFPQWSWEDGAYVDCERRRLVKEF